jgi:hypothetical protein
MTCGCSLFIIVTDIFDMLGFSTNCTLICKLTEQQAFYIHRAAGSVAKSMAANTHKRV